LADGLTWPVCQPFFIAAYSTTPFSTLKPPSKSAQPIFELPIDASVDEVTQVDPADGELVCCRSLGHVGLGLPSAAFFANTA
jgi:hypothetical protein